MEQLDEVGVDVDYVDGEIPLTDGGMGDSQDVAGITTFLLSDLAKRITRTPVSVDGVESLLQ